MNDSQVELSFNLETIGNEMPDMPEYAPVMRLMIRADLLRKGGMRLLAQRVERCVEIADHVYDTVTQQ